MTAPAQRTVIPTESPGGEVITEDCREDGSKNIRLWSKSFDYVGRWCFTCKCWHMPVVSDRTPEA